MSTPGPDRRAAIAACGAFALQTAMRGGALAQSRPGVRRHQGRRRALARQRRRPDRDLGRAGAAAPARSSLVRPPDAEGRDAHGARRLSHSRAEQGQPGLGQHQRHRDGRRRYAASTGDIAILGLGDRSGDDRAIESCPCVGRRAGAGVLDRARSVIRLVG